MESSGLLQQKLEAIYRDLGFLGPELLLATGFLVLMITDLILSGHWKKSILPGLALVFTLCAFYMLWLTWQEAAVPRELLFGHLIADKQGMFVKAVFLLGLAATLLFPSGFKLRPEYFYVLLSLCLGAMFMAGSKNLLSVYLTTELTSVSGYILAVFGFKKLNYEAGLKYLLFGAFGSGLMLYGISLLYGLTGNLDFLAPGFLQALQSGPDELMLASVVLLLLGLFFKISLFPMHLWTPDVYQASPVPVAAIFSVLPKIAALVILLRLSQVLAAISYFEEIMLISAVISITFGNLAALAQSNVRRMLAYSSIAQAGFLLVPLAIGDGFALTSFYFYSFIYLFMNFLAFYLVDHLESEGKFSVSDYAGIGLERAYTGILFLISMISLTGLPPVAGFTAKLYIFSSIWGGWQTSRSDLLFYLLLIAAVNTVIALFYYLKVPYFMFFKGKQEKTSTLSRLSYAQLMISSLLACMLVYFFLKPDTIVSVIQHALSQ